MNHVLRSKILAFVTRLSMCALACTSTMHVCAADQRDVGAVEIIVPFGPGGGADHLARESAKLLGGILAAPVKVTNVVGGTGNVGMAKLIAAPNDGNTVAVLTADTFTLLAYLNPGWKQTDVIPIAIMMKQPSALFLAENGRFKTWSDFEKEARLRPETLRVAITGLGSPDYLTLQQMAARGIKLIPVPLANPEERYRAPLDGKADALYEQLGDVKALVEAKQIRPVLAFSVARLPGFEAVPTSHELGFGDGFDQFRAIVVRAGTDPEKIKMLSDALEKVAALPGYKSFLEAEAASSKSYVPAKNAAAFMQTELAMMKKIVEALPFHARFILDAREVETYVEPF